MHVSLSEVEATITKAALAVGLPLGLGDEAGAAARHAVVAGFDPLAAFLLALEGLDQGRASGFEPEAALAGLFRARRGRLSALAAGPSALDLLAAGGIGRASLLAVDAPAAIVALALAASTPLGRTIVLETGGGAAAAVCRGGALGLARGRAEDLAAPGPCDLTLHRGDDEGGVRWRPAAETSALSQGAEVEAALWRRLTALADRRLVAGTEESRLAGAGAGVVDTD